jgi:creatinine amidohydrolase
MTTSPAPPVRWDELAWTDIAERIAGGMDMAILPVGATEQHGPHLQVGMDTLAATTVAEGVSARTGVPVLPSLPYGCSLGHSRKWPGTISLRPATLAAVVEEIADWLSSAGVRNLLILNGHITNWAPLRCALETIRVDREAMWVSLLSLWDISERVQRMYYADVVGFHANRAETAMVLATRPDLVHMERAVDEPDRAVDTFFSYTVDRESETGTTGNPTEATAEFGHELLAACIDDLSARVLVARAEQPPLDERPDFPATMGRVT